MAGYKTAGGWTDVTSAGRNDIVFEGRFKEYGAYFVRTRYHKTLTIAFGAAVIFGIIAISTPLILKVLGAGKKSEEPVRNVVVHMTAPPPPTKPPPTPPPPPPPPEKLIQQLKVTPPVVAKQVIDTIPPPTVTQTQTTNVGTVNQKGKDTIIAPIATNTTIGDDNNDQPLTVVQQMPAFNGNLQSYLSDHINYPEYERENNITGKVYVTFVVEKDGSITNVKVLRGVSNGPNLDKEAVRVVKNMPKWNVGMQNGHPVRVQFNLPINFQLR